MDGQDKVGKRFDEAARSYDSQRRMLIPCFDDFYGTAVALAETEASTPRILDLGAGTGLLSGMLLRKYPNAKLTLIDVSEKMLEQARRRLIEYERVEFICGDYTDFVRAGEFDLVVSALSIHHLTDPEKRRLYANAYANLKPRGLLVNADQVLGQTPYIDDLYKEDWKRKVEASELSREAKDAAYERTKLDRMAPLDSQLGWLEEAGFAEVDCVYKYYNFTVFFGRK